MVLRMSRPTKHPRTGVYWLRKRVPADIEVLIGRQVITKTLGTRDELVPVVWTTPRGV